MIFRPGPMSVNLDPAWTKQIMFISTQDTFPPPSVPHTLPMGTEPCIPKMGSSVPPISLWLSEYRGLSASSGSQPSLLEPKRLEWF